MASVGSHEKSPSANAWAFGYNIKVPVARLGSDSLML
jgi:hypothetical protein